MIQLENIVNTIIASLNQQDNGLYVRYNLIQSADNDLPYPYTTINVTSPYNQQTSNIPKIELIDNGENLTERRKEQPTVTLSINSYSKDEIECVQVFNNTMAYFKHVLYDEFAEHDIIVVEVTGAGNRSSILEAEYEYRYGFDVVLRVPSILNRIIDFARSTEIDANSKVLDINLNN